MTTLKTLADHLAAEQTADDAVKDVVAVIAAACVQISRVVASGAISGSLGAAGQINVQDEEQKKLDIITNDILRDALKACRGRCRPGVGRAGRDRDHRPRRRLPGHLRSAGRLQQYRRQRLGWDDLLDPAGPGWP